MSKRSSSPSSDSSTETSLKTPSYVTPRLGGENPARVMAENGSPQSDEDGVKEEVITHSHGLIPSISLNNLDHHVHHDHDHQHHHDHPRHSSTGNRILSNGITGVKAPSTRAPPPPPILLRRPTGSESISHPPVTPTSSSRSFNSGTSLAGGLNIPGLPTENTSTVELESDDHVPDLLASPMRAFSPSISTSRRMEPPPSPAWQSLESPASWDRRRSLEIPTSASIPSPLGSSSRARFEPTPHHGIHSRNLSLFFPQPGGSRPEGTGIPISPLIPEMPGDSLIPLPEGRKVFEGTGQWTFGASAPGQAVGGGLEPGDGVQRGKRRGHHHKHSLSHNFFSFLDPTQTNPSLAPPSPIVSSTPSHSHAQHTEPPSPSPSHNHTHDHTHTHSHAHPHPVPTTLQTPFPASPTLSPLPPSKISISTHKTRLLKSFAVLEFVIGSGLWVEGQMSGWRCLAGLGYLVVFDAIGVWVGCMGGREDGWKSFRRPYGLSRLNSLLYFAQSLFLVFAAVYIAKESIEQVLLGPGHEHGAGGHDHGGGSQHVHGDDADVEDERAFPHFLLVCATFASLFSGGVLGNHSKLVDAVGTLFLPVGLSTLTSPLAKKFAPLLGNPFTLTIAGSSAAILLGSLIVPPASLHSLDSSVSLLLTILTTALSYPPTLTFAHVLLQTAPSPSQNQMKSLKKAIKEVKDDKRILGVGTMRCWMVSAGQGGGDVPDLPKVDGRETLGVGNGFQNKWENGVPSTPGPKLTRRTSSTALAASAMNNLLNPESAGYSTNFSLSPGNSPKDFEFNNITPSSYPSAYVPPKPPPTPTPSLDRRGLIRPPSLASLLSAPKAEGDVTLVVTLVVHVHPDTSDREIIEVTKTVWKRCNTAINGVSGTGGKKRDGEVSVAIKRGWEGLEEI